MTGVMDQRAEQTHRADSGIYRRVELERALRALTWLELRELVASGAVDELLDEDFEEDPLEL